jgi:hypothetical protein
MGDDRELRIVKRMVTFVICILWVIQKGLYRVFLNLVAARYLLFSIRSLRFDLWADLALEELI